MSTPQQYQGQVPPQQAQQHAQHHQAPQYQQHAQPQQHQAAQAHQGQPQQASGRPGGGSGGNSYTSPIPMTRTHLGHAIASEWTKIRSVRSTMWTLGVMFGLVVGIGLLVGIGLSGREYASTPLLAGGFFGLLLGQICIVTLGVLVITSEYGTGMIRTTLTACPARGRVLLAKAVVFFLLAFVTTTIACALTAFSHSVMLAGQKAPTNGNGEPLYGSVEGGNMVATGGEWLGATVGAGLYVALLGLLSLAVGALLRHSAGAITTMMGIILLPLVMALFMMAEALHKVRDFLLEYSPLNGLASLYRTPMSGDQGDTGWPLLGGLACVTVVALFAAYALLNKRDV